MVIGPSGIRTRAICKRYPVTEGLTAETTKQTKIPYLVPGQSLILKKDRIN
jgi:hypothetical protein